MSLNVVSHVREIFITNFPTISTGISPILSSDDILAYLLINLLGVGDGRITGHHYGLEEFSGFSGQVFLFDRLSLSEIFIIYIGNCLLQGIIQLPPLIIIFASQSLQLQSLSHLQEPVKLLLIDLNLSMVDVVQDELELPRGDSVKTEKRMGVFVVGEDMFEVTVWAIYFHTRMVRNSTNMVLIPTNLVVNHTILVWIPTKVCLEYSGLLHYDSHQPEDYRL